MLYFKSLTSDWSNFVANASNRFSTYSLGGELVVSPFNTDSQCEASG